MAENRNFKYTYRAPTEEERREIEAIRREYSAPESGADKLDELRRLDERVKRLPKIVGLSCGIVGVLVFGLGMSLALVWERLVGGAVASALGAAISACGYSLYKLTLKRNQKKYGKQILALTEELLNAEENKDR
ncbi:MAG: hypothetical protein ACI4NG_01655 [Candidatus Gallimonas sp.]